MARQGGRGALPAAGGRGAGDGRGHRRHAGPGGAAVPVDAGQDRPDQPGAARADHRRPGDPRVRPRPGRRAERFGDANADLTATALRVNRVFALALPALMVILNLSSVAVLWFGGRLVSEGSMPIGNLTAFLTYILQILMSVMMAVMMVILRPARGGQRGTRRAGAGHRAVDRRPAEPGPPGRPRPAWSSSGDVTLRVPGQRAAGAARPVVHAPARARPARSSAGPAAARPRCSTSSRGSSTPPRGTRAGQRRRRAGPGARGAVGDDRAGPAGGVPVQRHGREQPAVRQARRRPTQSSGVPWRSPRRAISSPRCPGSSTRPIDQGGTNVSGGQRQRLSIARALVEAAAAVPVRRLLLGARRRDRRAAAGRPEDRDARRRGGDRRPAGEHDHARRPDHRAR